MNLDEFALVQVAWLKENLDSPNLVILDGSMKKTVAGPNINYDQVFIPGAIKFDFEKVICDSTSKHPHTMPSPEKFAMEVQKLGIRKSDRIVVYDNKGIYSAPRVWWMFKAMGHDRVGVLNGGLPAWQEAGYPLSNEPQSRVGQGDFQSTYRCETIYSAEDVLEAIDDDQIQMIDVRAEKRFYGTDPEPRPGLRSGHIPSAINIPFKSVLDGSKLIEFDELKRQLEDLIPDKNKRLVFNCGSGVTSCVVALAAYICGYANLSVYDGSWSEWGARHDLPISKN